MTKKLPDSERLQAAQALIDRMVKEYGVAVVVTTSSVSVSDGSTIVRPQVTLQLIPNWQEVDEK